MGIDVINDAKCRCANPDCFIHDGETCAIGEMNHIECQHFRRANVGDLLMDSKLERVHELVGRYRIPERYIEERLDWKGEWYAVAFHRNFIAGMVFIVAESRLYNNYTGELFFYDSLPWSILHAPTVPDLHLRAWLSSVVMENECKKNIGCPEVENDDRKFCNNNCRWLSPTEEEQQKSGIKDFHMCGKYHSRVRHVDAHPRLYRLSRCDEE